MGNKKHTIREIDLVVETFMNRYIPKGQLVYHIPKNFETNMGIARQEAYKYLDQVRKDELDSLQKIRNQRFI